jgi:hypothetical protein
MFKYYGDDIYKIGETNNCEKRTNGYVIAYIKPPEIGYESPLLPYSQLVESLVFSQLADCRIQNNREFFRCNIERIKKTINEVSILLLNTPDLSIIKESFNNSVSKSLSQSEKVDLVMKIFGLEKIDEDFYNLWIH